MRQMVAFIKAIEKRSMTNDYQWMSFFAKLHHMELPPLEQILGVSSNKERSAFDPESDKKLEEFALRRLEEKRREIGR